MLLVALLSRLSFAADEEVIFKQSADGTRNTRPFTVKDNWELRWSTKGAGLAIIIYDTEQNIRGSASQNSSGEGSSYQPKGGTFYLNVTGFDEWTVTVVQLP